MATGTELIKRLRDTRNLTPGQYKALLDDNDPDDAAFLRQQARAAADSVFGKSVYIRGLIEISNHCRNNCFYCGIRAGNAALSRYRLNKEEILGCCRSGYASGFRTFVLQGGEDGAQTDGWVEDVIRAIRSEFPDCAVTLSLGEKSPESYRRFRNAGADRYLLRHETYDRGHYARLHPASMSRENRLACLTELKAGGWQTGTGIMVGSPFQTLDNIAEDLAFIQGFHPEMVGIGPFVHHCDTPFADMPDGSVELTLKLISILRLMNPCALIPATTSLVTLDPEGRAKGIMAGANVVMPSLTPPSKRPHYALYEGKACSGAESAEGMEMLRTELDAIGYKIAVSRGDYDNKRISN